MKSLEVRLRQVRDEGRKILVPYLMAGATPDWLRYVEAVVAGGADAVEIGVPFSDPMMDGVVIQEAGLRALAAGTTFDSTCASVATLDVGVPLAAMTYYNIFHHHGLVRSAGLLHASGISGAIVPDLALEESDEWRAACDQADVATVLLVAPSTPEERVARLAATSEGFVYAAARMAVTGRAQDVGESAAVVRSIRRATDMPVLVGIGISTPDQASSAAREADGVIVGSALVQRILDGASPVEVENFVAQFRAALNQEK